MISKPIRFLIRFIAHTGLAFSQCIEQELIVAIGSLLVFFISDRVSVDDVVDAETQDADTGTDEYTEQGIDEKEAAI